MQSIKKAVRLTLFVLLILLATLGIGLSGGVPIPTDRRRQRKLPPKVELMMEKDESTEAERPG